jgi:AbrB family looped-hinge helix DNA binding protein
MTTLTVSSKGQIVLPAEVRRRLGLGAGAKIEIVEEADGLHLRVVSAVNHAKVASLVGMVKARSLGVTRRLQDFDPASMLRRPRKP